MVKESVLRGLAKAGSGREIWLGLLDRHGIKDCDYVILFPSPYDEWAYFGALYLDDFLDSKGSERAVALCYDQRIKSCVAELSKKAEIVDFSKEEAEKLIAFHSLYMFTDNLVIFSPDKPAGRNGNAIVGKKGITIEEVAAIGLYGLNKLKDKTRE